MNGATLLSIAACSASHTFKPCRCVQVSPLESGANTKVMLAFLATPPDHSRSRSDSPSSPGQRVGVPAPTELEFIVTVLAGSWAALRKLFRSLVATVLCPTTAIFWFDPVSPAVYNGVTL